MANFKLKINCLSNDENNKKILENDNISWDDINTSSNTFQKTQELFNILKYVFKREIPDYEKHWEKDLFFKEYLNYFFNEISNNTKYIYQLGFNQTIKNNNLFNFFKYTKDKKMKNISLFVKNKDGSKILKSNKDTVTLFFEILLNDENEKLGTLNKLKLEWKLTRIDFQDLTKFKNKKGFIELESVEFVQKINPTNIQELIDNNKELNSVLSIDDFNKDTIELNKYLKFLKLLPKTKEKFKIGEIINNSLEKFEEIEEKNDDNEENFSYKLPNVYDLIFISEQEIKELKNKEINISKIENEENMFKKWRIDLKKCTKEDLLYKLNEEIKKEKETIKNNIENIKNIKKKYYHLMNK